MGGELQSSSQKLAIITIIMPAARRAALLKELEDGSM